MSTFFFMLLAGFVWMGLRGDLSPFAFAFGALLGAGIAWAEGARAHRPFGLLRGFRVARIALVLAVVFLRDLFVANLQQLRIVLAPRVEVHPGWIRFETRLETHAMRALLCAMISLIPGSLTYDENEGPDGECTIGLHVLDVRSEREQIEVIRSRFEERLLAMERM